MITQSAHAHYSSCYCSHYVFVVMCPSYFLSLQCCLECSRLIRYANIKTPVTVYSSTSTPNKNADLMECKLTESMYLLHDRLTTRKPACADREKWCGNTATILVGSGKEVDSIPLRTLHVSCVRTRAVHSLKPLDTSSKASSCTWSTSGAWHRVRLRSSQDECNVQNTW